MSNMRQSGSRQAARALALLRARVDELQPPEHVAAEVRVVEHLGVERLRPALEQQLEERLALGLARRLLLALAGRADERGVRDVAGRVGVVRVRAAVEQRPRDRDGVLDHRRVVKRVKQR